MQSVYYCQTPQFNSFLTKLTEDYKVFCPREKSSNKDKNDYCYAALSKSSDFVYNPYRALEPLKTFFTPPLEKVTDYFTPNKEVIVKDEKVILFGVKNCDIYGHKIQDFVFLEGVEVDAPYRLRRQNTIFISSDCTDYKDVCHCLAWDILPYPEAGFDLNLSILGDGFLVEVGSIKGEDLIRRYKDFFSAAKDTQILARKAKREALSAKLRKHILSQDLVAKDTVQHLVKAGYNAETWKSFMLTCVECGGCNLICDTCHCFLLADKKVDSCNEKIRVWDSCLYANYARVAGGANPLKTRASRLRNRFMKKFDFFVDNLNMPACCGCGRCIEVCPGKIDIREVLKDLRSKEKKRE